MNNSNKIQHSELKSIFQLDDNGALNLAHIFTLVGDLKQEFPDFDASEEESAFDKSGSEEDEDEEDYYSGLYIYKAEFLEIFKILKSEDSDKILSYLFDQSIYFNDPDGVDPEDVPKDMPFPILIINLFYFLFKFSYEKIKGKEQHKTFVQEIQKLCTKQTTSLNKEEFVKFFKILWKLLSICIDKFVQKITEDLKKSELSPLLTLETWENSEDWSESESDIQIEHKKPVIMLHTVCAGNPMNSGLGKIDINLEQEIFDQIEK
ncbi:hypothetical protein M0812_28402 [Anaeramoeba flamelloides]|uniref:Uncharacterized protein n=1 Tax=Anaeramoeba flamelloides TaxID=1746091 RepID=A0AAV7YBJ7_9EUKA|nr:hypothetical protein M0812_28402 [Anaeramoeba flamelloides]